MKNKLLSVPIMVLFCSLLLPSLSTVAQSGTGSDKSASRRIGVVAPIDYSRNLAKMAGPGHLVAENVVCQAEFSSHGFRYVPKMREALQPQSDFTYRLKSIGTKQQVYLAHVAEEGSEPTAEGNQVSYERASGITEVYQTLDEGVEQLFVLDRNLNPAGDEFRITGELTTSLRAESSHIRTWNGIMFYAGKVPTVNYGAAKVIDAAGNELKAELELDGSQLSIIVNSAWLRTAVYPVIVDPFVGPHIQIAGPGAHLAYPTVAADSVNNRYLVVWEQTVGTDIEIMGQLLELNGTPSVCSPVPFSISGNSIRSDLQPSVAFDPSTGRFLVVWEERGGFGTDSTLKGRFIGAAGTCATTIPGAASFPITRATGVVERAASVAVGIPAGNTNSILVAYLRGVPGGSQVDVMAQLLNQNGVQCGGPTPVGNTSGFDLRYQPVAEYGEQSIADFFAVLYRSSDRSLRMGRVSPRCGSSPMTELVVERIVTDGPAETEGAATNVKPSLVYNDEGHRWLINWVNFHAKLGATLRWLELPPNLDIAQSRFTTLLGASRTVRGIFTTSSSQNRDVVVAISTGVPGNNPFGLLVFQLHYDVEYFSTTIPRDQLAGSNNWSPVVVANPIENSYFVVWCRDLANGGSDVVGRMYLP